MIRTGDGLHYASAGIIHVRWDLLSNQTCKIRYFWYFQSDSLSQYLLLALAVERVISLYRPFAVRVWATRRNGFWLLVLLTSASIILAIPVLNDFEINEYSITNHELRCIMVQHDWMQLTRFVLVNALLSVNVPRIAVFVCTVILSRKIRRTAALHHRFREVSFESRNGNRNGNAELRALPIPAIPRRELRLARPVFLCAFLELLVSLQLIVAWTVYYLFEYLRLSPEWVKIAGAGGHMAVYVTIVPRIWSLYIYCATIPAFRHELLRRLPFKRRARTGRLRANTMNTPGGAAIGAHRNAASRDSHGGGPLQSSRSGTESEICSSNNLKKYHITTQ